MKVMDVIKLTEHETIEEIAKKHLTISGEETRTALKNAGCYHVIGEKAWRADEINSPLNLAFSIYYFHEQAVIENLRKSMNERNFKYTTTLHSKATVSYKGEIINGKVTMISEKGINLKTVKETNFYKWNQILNVVPKSI